MAMIGDPRIEAAAQRVRDYRDWLYEQHDEDGEVIGSLADYDEARTDWWNDLAITLVDLVQGLGYVDPEEV
jgi:hypothetical protein